MQKQLALQQLRITIIIGASRIKFVSTMIYDFIEENSQSTKWLYISAFYHDPVYYQKCYLRILVLQQNHHIATA